MATSGSRPEYANGRLVFVCELLPRAEWHVCVKWLPVIGPRPARTLPCHSLVLGEARRMHQLPPVELITSHPTLPAIWRQAVEDTDALRMVDTTVSRSLFVPAAGILDVIKNHVAGADVSDLDPLLRVRPAAVLDGIHE